MFLEYPDSIWEMSEKCLVSVRCGKCPGSIFILITYATWARNQLNCKTWWNLRKKSGKEAGSKYNLHGCFALSEKLERSRRAPWPILWCHYSMPWYFWRTPKEVRFCTFCETAFRGAHVETLCVYRRSKRKRNHRFRFPVGSQLKAPGWLVRSCLQK